MVFHCIFLGKKGDHYYIRIGKKVYYIFSWLAFLSPQVFDLEIIILNNYLIAFENGITDEMYRDIDYPGKDIVVFFTTVSEWAHDHFFRFNLRGGDI